MESLFITLTHALEGTPLMALMASLAWGGLSVVLSPCHLASIPLIVGFINGQQEMDTRRAFWLSIFFSLGILITIALIGVATSMAGRMLGDVGALGTYFVAAIFFAVGLHLFGVLPMPWNAPGTVGVKRKGVLGALLLGLLFGIALGPCTFAYLAPILGLSFSLAASQALLGISLIVAYSLGHCAVIVFAGTFSEAVQRYLNWNEASRGPIILKKVCASLVMAGGIYMVYMVT